MPFDVSVLVPTYNRAHLLSETLDAILSQSRVPAEVIVLDDGSTDDTAEVCRRFGKRINYQYTSNGGICRARNVAASHASSAFLAFCDHDDLWRKDKLEQQMALHDADARVQYSFTNFAIVSDGIWSGKTEFDHAPDRSFPPYSLPGSEPVVLETSLYDQILAFQPVRPSTVVISASLFRQIGKFREELGKNPSEDVEFTLRCMQHPPIGIVREPVVGIRVYAGNYSGEAYRNTLGQIEIFEFVLKHHQISSDTRKRVEHELHVRQKWAAYDAFRRSDFERVVEMLRQVPAALLDGKDRAKFWISKAPLPIAKTARRFLMKD